MARTMVRGSLALGLTRPSRLTPSALRYLSRTPILPFSPAVASYVQVLARYQATARTTARGGPRTTGKTTGKPRRITPRTTAGVWTAAKIQILGLGRIFGYAVVITTLCWILFFLGESQWLMVRYPTPLEWTFLSRTLYQITARATDPGEHYLPTWPSIYNKFDWLRTRLEDVDVDGTGVEGHAEAAEDLTVGLDIRAKGGDWTRAYYDTLSHLAKAAEYVDGWVVDKRGVPYPPEVVHGPSNPEPRPFGFAKTPPTEADCKPGFESANTWYARILSTRGFSPRQRMDAALKYATFLEFKGNDEAAESNLELALDIANKSAPTPFLTTAKSTYDPKTRAFNPDSKPSANQLTALTAVATFKARHGAVDEALPMLISILRARRSNLAAPNVLEIPRREEPEGWTATGWFKYFYWVEDRPYPGVEPDGSRPPRRDAGTLCEEAALNAYIGEIMFAKGSQLEGLAWTREAVDLSEEQLHRVKGVLPVIQLPVIPEQDDNDEYHYAKRVRKSCRDCLRTGLGNWEGMVELMAKYQKEEETKASEAQKARWLPFWGQEAKVDGRWEAEGLLVQDRMRRAEDVLYDGVSGHQPWYMRLVNA